MSKCSGSIIAIMVALWHPIVLQYFSNNIRDLLVLDVVISLPGENYVIRPCRLRHARVSKVQPRPPDPDYIIMAIVNWHS